MNKSNRILAWRIQGVIVVLLFWPTVGYQQLPSKPIVFQSGTPKIGTPFDVIPHLMGNPEPYGTYFHGPTTIVAENGDLLVASAQGRMHDIGVIVQSRSTDGGVTWNYEGVVYDQSKRNPHESCYNPAYALSPDGTLVMFVQTTNPEVIVEGEAGPPELRFGGEHMAGCVYLISSDSGKTYDYKGYIDPLHPKYIDTITTNVITQNGTIYFVSGSFDVGVLLYTSVDNGETWQMRSPVFPSKNAPRKWYPDTMTGPLWYPTLTILPDESIYVLALAFLPDGEERNYSRISVDDGNSWGPIKLEEGISARKPFLNWIGETLILHARHTPTQDMTFHYSHDYGKSWSPRQIIEDYYTDGGYSSSVNLGEKLFIAFSSDKGEQVLPKAHPQHEVVRICGIRGVFLSL